MNEEPEPDENDLLDAVLTGQVDVRMSDIEWLTKDVKSHSERLIIVCDLLEKQPDSKSAREAVGNCLEWLSPSAEAEMTSEELIRAGRLAATDPDAITTYAEHARYEEMLRRKSDEAFQRNHPKLYAAERAREQKKGSENE
jgi:hypothetical protein